MKDRVFVPNLIRMRKRGESIVMVTAYDYTFAQILDAADVDIVLVGDSLASVIQGEENTIGVTLDQVIYHSGIVSRGVERALVVADMPFMSFQLGPKEALQSAGRLVQEGGAGAVKLEGGCKIKEQISRIVDAGIPVMGHVGLLPQHYHQIGGHRIQGRGAKNGEQILEDALAVEKAGAFSLVLEGIPEQLAKEITETVSIPTIGIGAGGFCSGQVLVMHDLLGLSLRESAHDPKFIRRYGELGQAVLSAAKRFCADVRGGQFPGEENTYYATNGHFKDNQRSSKLPSRSSRVA